MREEKIVFHTTMSREDIITTLKNTLEPDPDREEAIDIYYSNLANGFIAADGIADINTIYQWLSFTTWIAFIPKISQCIPKGQDRKEVILDRIKHSNDYPELKTEDDMSWVDSYRYLFSTMIDRVGNNPAFTQGFVAYTGIQIQDGEDEDSVTA